MRKKELIDTIAAMQNKYTDLLWYARTNSENTIPAVNENGELIDIISQHIDRIETLYPIETEALAGEHGNWQHGFHSGIVAALRYVLTLDDLGKDQADEWFPELDS
jgi:hypothetical protein